jgi:selenide,water dikinase
LNVWAVEAVVGAAFMALARAGVRTGAAVRNWDSYGDAVILPAGFDSWRRDLLCDPQTSGGLLISAAPEATQEVLTMVRDAGFAGSAIVGELATGSPGIVVV